MVKSVVLCVDLAFYLSFCLRLCKFDGIHWFALCVMQIEMDSRPSRGGILGSNPVHSEDYRAPGYRKLKVHRNFSVQAIF